MNGNTIFKINRKYSREGGGVGFYLLREGGVVIFSADVRTE